MARQLASVRKLDDVLPHPNADRLAIGRVGGWDVVVPKSCAVGETGVYFEIDSDVPAGVVGEDRNLKVKTRKIRGVLSQGLFIPLQDIPFETTDWQEGQDVTETLDVVPTQPPDDFPLCSRSGRMLSMPAFQEVCPEGLAKTSEARIQSNMWLLDRMRDRPYYVTLKYNGTSGTFVIDGTKLTVCSRNLQAQDGSVYHQAASSCGLYDKAKTLGLAFQGEVYGPGINGNQHGVDRVRLAIFNVFDVYNKRYYNYEEMRIVLKVLNVDMVEVVETGECFTHSLSSLLQLARGKYAGTRNHREGIVVRSRNDTRCSFKVLNNEHLLHN